MLDSDFCRIEKNVSDRVGSYRGIEEAALLTSVEDFKRIFSSLKIETWVELGSAHGRGPLLFAQIHSDKQAIGIEFEAARISFSNEQKQLLGLSNVNFIHADLLTADIPIADTYFFYFPTGPVLDRVLRKLSKCQGARIVVVESHGDFLPRLSKERWLKKIQEIPLSSARHYTQAVVFEVCGEIQPSLHDYSYQKQYLLIQDASDQTWIGETIGLEWLREDEYQLATPPRTIKEHEVKSILNQTDIPRAIIPAVQLRSMGCLNFVTKKGNFNGFIRKIYVAPSFKLEIATFGEVEWEDVSQIFWENQLCYDSHSDFFYCPPVL